MEIKMKNQKEDIGLTDERKKEIGQAVDRLFRMKAKRAIRNLTNVITYPIYKQKN
jgi:hypothetical protein